MTGPQYDSPYPKQFNPLLPDFVAHRYAYYRHYREHDPVNLGIPTEPEAPDTWYLFRHEDVASVLKDSRFVRDRARLLGVSSSQPPETTRPFVEVINQWMLFRDPPDHTRLRALVNKAFTPRIVNDLKPRIQDITNHLIERGKQAGHMDLIADFAYPLPVMVIAEMLGALPEDREQFRRWSVVLAKAIDVTASMDIYIEASQVVVSLLGYLREILSQRRKQPQSDLISGLITAEAERHQVTESEILSTCVLLLLAGHETTVNLLGNGMLNLLQHPDQKQLLVANPELMTNAIEELLRFDSPVQMTFRFAAESLNLGGKMISKGDGIAIVIGAANRDPVVFTDPDQLNIQRDAKAHASFGAGIHYCVGAPLARAEGQIAIQAMLQAFPNLQLGTNQLEWRSNIVFAGLERLPVNF